MVLNKRTFLKTLPFAAVGVAAAAGGNKTVAGQPAEAGATTTRGKRSVSGGSPNFSRAVGFERLVFVSGVLGTDPESRKLVSDAFEAQCRQVLSNLKASIEAGGSSLEKVLKCTCFLTSAADFEAFNKVYRESFPAEPPARSTVVVKELVLAGAKVEIECVAHT